MVAVKQVHQAVIMLADQQQLKIAQEFVVVMQLKMNVVIVKVMEVYVQYIILVLQMRPILLLI